MWPILACNKQHEKNITGIHTNIIENHTGHIQITDLDTPRYNPCKKCKENILLK